MKTLYKYTWLFLFFQVFISCTSETKNTKNVPEKLEANTSQDAHLSASFRSPVMVSSDFGKTWEAASNNLPEDTQVSFLEKKGAEIVLASDNRGVFISQGNVSEWKPIGESLPNPKINALHISEEEIFVGVYEKGIYTTKNEGKSWESINYNLTNLAVQSIFKLQDKLFIGTDDGIFTLQPSENTWKPTDVKAQVLSIYEYEGRLIAGTSQGTLLSNDEGKSWEWIRKEGAVHYTHNVENRIVELLLTGELFFSDDWGNTWNAMHYEPTQGSYVYEIIGVNAFQLISNNYGIHQSADQGQSWELIFKTESMAFFDFLSVGDFVYGGTRSWDEYRKRN